MLHRSRGEVSPQSTKCLSYNMQLCILCVCWPPRETPPAGHMPGPAASGGLRQASGEGEKWIGRQIETSLDEIERHARAWAHLQQIQHLGNNVGAGLQTSSVLSRIGT